MNPYSVLQLDQTATQQQIRERYHYLSKTFHPDKQPTEHYDTAREYFFKVDTAFKAIENPLKRFVFRQFGQSGILLLDQFKQQFLIYEDTIDQPEVQQIVRQLIFHCHFHHKSDHQEQMTNTECMSSINTVYHEKRRTYYGKSLAHVALFASSVPSIRGVHNVLMMEVDHIGDKPTVVSFKTVSTAHYKDILITNQMRFSEDVSGQLTLSKPLTPYATLNITPLIYAANRWHTPRVSISSAISKTMNIQVTTDGTTSSVELARGSENSATRLKYTTIQNMSQISLTYQHKLNPDSSIMFGVTASATPQPNKLSLTLQHFYGLKIDLGSGNKLQLKSMFGRYNYLEIKMSSGKYVMRCPLFSQNVELLHYEIAKLVAMVSIYAVIKGIKRTNRKYIERKQKLLRKHYSRLQEDRTKVNTMINDAKDRAESVRRYELATHGLVIIKALYGSSNSINTFKKKYDKYAVRPEATMSYVNSLANADQEELLQPQNEIYDITNVLQSHVIGARIVDYEPKLLSPCLESNETPVLYVRYYLKGQNHTLTTTKFPITIGKMRQKSRNIINRMISWFRVNFV